MFESIRKNKAVKMTGRVLLFCMGVTPRKPENILWINGTYAPLTATYGNDITIFGGSKKTNKSKASAIELLNENWSITNKQELIETIDLLRNGADNSKFIECLYGLGLYGINDEDFKILLSGYNEPEEIECIKLFHNNYRKFTNNVIMGWELSRATSLCGSAYLAGYYTYDEAIFHAIDISKQIQNTFDSWDSFFQSYMCGYRYWSKQPMLDKDSYYYKRLIFINKFKNDYNSFYHLDWNLKLDDK